MVGRDERRREQSMLHFAARQAAGLSPRLLGAIRAFAALSGAAFISPSALAQPPQPPYVVCPADNPLLNQIPELVSDQGKLRKTILLTNGVQRLFMGDLSPDGKTRWCLPQQVRQFRGIGASPAGYPGTAPPAGYPGVVPTPPAQFLDPIPGPTLRARVGDIVQLTFLNQINPGAGWRSIDRGEKDKGCDQSQSQLGPVYPGPDEFPNCFHGSSTGNIHFHGTHTNPSTTGDNIFIEVRPSLRRNDNPIVTEKTFAKAFDELFAKCAAELAKSPISQWPRSWNDLPRAYTQSQKAMLKRYDRNPGITNKLWPVDEAQLKAGAWPQYYIGAFPYCFRLPEYTDTAFPPAGPAHPAAHTSVAREEARPLLMGQAPGIHWYHAHKHGSTTINVSNGMTGAFIIEGAYDDALSNYYGGGPAAPKGWTRTQPVMVINQLGTVPALFAGGGGGLPLSVNGNYQPTAKMKPGEVQMWRIVNTSSRSGVYFNGFYPEPRPAPANPVPPWNPAAFNWKQLAQDGVQFPPDVYDTSNNPSFLIASGNRVDLLVQAPTAPGLYSLQYQDVVAKTGIRPPSITTLKTLLMVQVESGSPVTGNQSTFIPKDKLAPLPSFLRDIKPEEVRATKTVTFATGSPTNPPPAGSQAPFSMHMIDGKQFDGNVGQVVLLNTVEEWKVENATLGPPIDHPFHIHINPFQIVEVFDPKQKVTNSGGALVNKYVITADPNQTAPPDPTTQCLVNPDKRQTWVDCHRAEPVNNIWWDVFPIPAGVQGTKSDNTKVTIPGYFKMRSRFVDYTGQYVIHCHILAHEDRGMMTVVEVAPLRTPYSHQ